MTTQPTTSSTRRFRRLYREGLEEHLSDADKRTLEKARILGRQFMAAGGGVVELSIIHREIVGSLVSADSSIDVADDWYECCSDFLTEALAAYEMAFRDYKETNDQLRTLNDTLEERIEIRSRQLLDSQVEFQRLLERLPGIFYSMEFGPDPSLTFVSPQVENLLGFDPDSLTHSRWMEAIHPDDRKRVADSVEEAIGDDHAYTLEYRVRSDDGSYRWLRDEGILIEGRGHEHAQLYGLALDITERRQLEDHFIEAQKMEVVGQMAGSIAHDFKNLLAVILSFAQVMERELSDDSRIAEDAREIIRTTRQADDLVRQLLGFARSGSPQRSNQDLTDLTRSLRSMVERLVPPERTLAFALSDTPLPVVVDPVHLEQGLLNLVLNARKATFDDDEVTVGTGRISRRELPENTAIESDAHRFAQLYVRDTGNGIADEDLPRIFDPFFTTDSHGRGTGLGLSTTRRLIRTNGGDIFVETEPGEGSCFRIVFPLADPPSDS